MYIDKLKRPSFVKFLDRSHFLIAGEKEYIISNSKNTKTYNTDYIKCFQCSNNNILIVEETGEIKLLKHKGFKFISDIKFRDEIKVSNNHVVIGIEKEKFYIIYRNT